METAIIAFAALAALLMAAILAPPARRRRARERLRAAWGRTDGGRALDEELVRDEAAGWRDIAATVTGEVNDAAGFAAIDAANAEAEAPEAAEAGPADSSEAAETTTDTATDTTTEETE